MRVATFVSVMMMWGACRCGQVRKAWEVPLSLPGKDIFLLPTPSNVIAFSSMGVATVITGNTSTSQPSSLFPWSVQVSDDGRTVSALQPSRVLSKLFNESVTCDVNAPFSGSCIGDLIPPWGFGVADPTSLFVAGGQAAVSDGVNVVATTLDRSKGLWAFKMGGGGASLRGLHFDEASNRTTVLLLVKSKFTGKSDAVLADASTGRILCNSTELLMTAADAAMAAGSGTAFVMVGDDDTFAGTFGLSLNATTGACDIALFDLLDDPNSQSMELPLTMPCADGGICVVSKSYQPYATVRMLRWRGVDADPVWTLDVDTQPFHDVSGLSLGTGANRGKVLAAVASPSGYAAIVLDAATGEVVSTVWAGGLALKSDMRAVFTPSGFAVLTAGANAEHGMLSAVVPVPEDVVPTLDAAAVAARVFTSDTVVVSLGGREPFTNPLAVLLSVEVSGACSLSFSLQPTLSGVTKISGPDAGKVTPFLLEHAAVSFSCSEAGEVQLTFSSSWTSGKGPSSAPVKVTLSLASPSGSPPTASGSPSVSPGGGPDGPTNGRGQNHKLVFIAAGAGGGLLVVIIAVMVGVRLSRKGQRDEDGVGTSYKQI